MTIISRSDNQRALPHFIQSNVPLSDKNWFQTGGPAKLFAAPTTAQEFQLALSYAHAHQEPLFILGQGANILISDKGFDGLVIKPSIQDLTHTVNGSEALVTAGAGVTVNDLIEYCLAHNLIGLEDFSGIPGSIGGAVFINLHYFEFLLGDFLVSARVINKETGVISTVDQAWFNFGYDISTLHDHTHYLVSATFKVNYASDLEIAFARGRRQEIIRHRDRRYPKKNTCGSFFRNFHPEEVTLEVDKKRMIFVAYYLDKIGVKGNLRVGNAMVSYQHANMLVNLGNATSHDIMSLARHMQRLVKEQFGIVPQPECILVGNFDE